jgi:hypothetical protein
MTKKRANPHFTLKRSRIPSDRYSLEEIMEYKFKPTAYHKSRAAEIYPNLKTYFVSQELARIIDNAVFPDENLEVAAFSGYIHLGQDNINGMVVERASGLNFDTEIRIVPLRANGLPATDLSEKLQQECWTWANKLIIYLQYRDLLLNIKPPKYMLQRKPTGEFISNGVYIHDGEVVRHLNVKSWSVRPHFRMQACGQGFTQRKLILVKEHTKSHKKLA